MYLIADTPLLYAHIRDEFLFDHEQGQGAVTPCMILAASAVQGRALGFQVLLEDGSCWARRPIHALCWREGAPARPLHELQAWDCFSYNIAVAKLAGLASLTVEVLGASDHGQYEFTIDYAEGGYSEIPDQHKQHHLIRLDDGNFGLYPNNRLRWREDSFTRWDQPLRHYRADSRVYYAER